MKLYLGIAAATLILASLGGCAAVTKEQCIAGDWADLGKAHASVGKPADHLDEVVKSCGKHGITPDTKAYLSGWNQGLLNYCTPLNGFTLGKQNKQRSSICPPQTANGFNQAYQLGNVIWKANYRVDQAESKILSIESTVNELNDRLYDLKCKDKKKDDRKECRRELRELRENLSDAEYDLKTARYELIAVQAEAEFVTAATNAEATRLFAW